MFSESLSYYSFEMWYHGKYKNILLCKAKTVDQAGGRHMPIEVATSSKLSYPIDSRCTCDGFVRHVSIASSYLLLMYP